MKSRYAGWLCGGILLACMFSAAAIAEEDGLDYGPDFAPELLHVLQPSPCKLEAASGFVMNSNDTTTAHCGGYAISITGVAKSRKHSADEDEQTTHVVVTLTGPQQKTLQATLRLEDFPADFIDSVEFADLNGDGKDDFIVNLSSHGNGLAAEIGGTLYLLSAATGYRYSAIAQVMTGNTRYMRLGDGKAALLVLQRLATDKSGSHSLRGVDGKEHTFFVFDLLQFDAGAAKGIKLGNLLDARFPFWTQYTDQPSHAETSKLASSRKHALWRDPLRRVVTGKLVESP